MSLTIPEQPVAPSNPGVEVLTIREFCTLYAISETFYRVLRRKGLGPRELRLSPRRVLVTLRAAREWEMSLAEKQTAADAAAGHDTALPQPAAGSQGKHGNEARAATRSPQSRSRSG